MHAANLPDRAEPYWNESLRLASLARGEVIAFAAVLTGMSSLYAFGVLPDSSYLLFSIATIGMTYFLTLALLRKGGLVEGEVYGGFGRFFGVSFLSGLAIIVGYVLLIIPGIFLTVRWLPAMGFALAGDHGTTDALGEAWKRTEQNFWTLLGALAPALALNVAALGLIVFDSFGPGFDTGLGLGPISSMFGSDGYTILTLLTDLMTTLSTLAGIVVGIAAYSLMRDASESMTEIFE